jgi:predicted MFS family arabinose efflux permease
MLVGAGLASGLLALSRGGASGWNSPAVILGFVAAVGLLSAWVAVERRSSNPLIDLSLLRNTPFTVANVLNVLANGTMFAIWLLTPYYLVTVRGLSTIAGGLMLGVAPLATAVAAPIAGRILGRVSTGRLSSVGLALEAAGLVAVALTDAETPLPVVAGAFALVGVGLGLFTVPNLLFVMGSIPRDRQGVAGALSQMMRMIGVVAGVAGATLLFDARRSSHVADLAVAADDPSAFVAAYRDTFAVVAVLCAVAIALSLVRPARDRNVAA